MKMKKILMLLLPLVLLVGCTPVAEGNYKQGTYFGSIIDNYGGSSNAATAVVVVNESGKIESVFLDTVYVKDGVNTTKKILGDDYNMKVASPIKAEWHEQVKTLEEKIVAEQGLEWLKWSDEEKSKTDSVSGVTMKINALYEAAEKALNQARK